MIDNWEVAPRGTSKKIADLEKALADAFRAGWVARDSIGSQKNPIRFDDHGGSEWFETYLDQKDEK